MQVPTAIPALECKPFAELAWVATADKRVYGYIVYRSLARGGPFVRINRKIVQAQADTSGSPDAEFEYVDHAVVIGTTYYYYLDYVTNTGHKVRFSGVKSKTVGQPVCAED